MTLDRTILLLLLAALVALAARRLKLPYTVGLVLTGAGLALARVGGGAALTPQLIFQAFLPPLLFEAALSLPWRELRRDGLPLLTLSTLGVVLSAGVVAAGMTGGARWPWTSALIFGVLIAATDPVAVIAMLKENGVAGRLRLLVEAESLFNDGVAAVFFTLALALATGARLTGLGAAQELAVSVAGGIGIGLACGGVALGLAGHTTDSLVETTLTAVAAYGSFSLAQHFHASGVLATVSAGMLLGNVGVLRGDDRQTLSQRGREVVIAFWEFAAFVANSLIFLLLGLGVARQSFGRRDLWAVALAIVLTLAGRAVSVYPLCALFRRGPQAIKPHQQHVLFWGGMRGALGLALALSLPESLPYRSQIVLAAFGVVAFSVIVQGVTMPLLLRRLKM